MKDAQSWKEFPMASLSDKYRGAPLGSNCTGGPTCSLQLWNQIEFLQFVSTSRTVVIYVSRIDCASYLASLCLSQHFSPSEAACANSSSTRFCLHCIHGKTWSHLPENCKHFLSAEASDVPANGFRSCCSSLCYSRPFPPFLLARQKAPLLTKEEHVLPV